MSDNDRVIARARSWSGTYVAAATAFAAVALAFAARPVFAVETEFDVDDGLVAKGEGWRAEAGARLHADGAWFSGGAATRGAEDGTLLRRARLRTAAERGAWSLRADYELGSVGPGWKNAWVQYQPNETTTLRLGSQSAPFGLEDTMSSDDLPFHERSSASALGPGLLTGLALRARTDRWTFALGGFGNNLSDDDRRQIDGRSVIARITHVPYRSGPVIVHVGASGEYRDASSGATFRLRPAIGTPVGDLRLLNTGRLTGVDTLLNTGAELGARLGPVTLQGEYVQSRLARNGTPDVSFDGWYVAGIWALTGERRRYSRRGGAFGELERPDRPAGALELAVRYGSLDLADANVDGGVERSLSVGVNWYIRPRIRVMLSHVSTEAERRGRDLDAPDVTLARVQLSF
jgi:phosphate-selective porin OprO/OprP